MNRVIGCDDKNSFQWGEGCLGWRLLETEELSNTRETKHFHAKAKQVFYIIEGEAKFSINNQDVIVYSGESIFIKKGEQHQLINHANKYLVFLVISTPSITNDRIDVE